MLVSFSKLVFISLEIKNLRPISLLDMKSFDFCYHCGRFGHSISSCDLLNSKIDYRYGYDLRADPRSALKSPLFTSSNSDHPSFSYPKNDLNMGSILLNSVS